MDPQCPLDCCNDNETRQIFDFTGTMLDTKAECQAMGLRFSDDDTPFPDNIYSDIDGTWTHVESVGWKAVAGDDSKGPAILIPLIRPRDWEINITFDFAVAAVGDQVRFIVGTMMSNNDFGAVGFVQDNAAGATELTWLFYTNDGDDSITIRHTGSAFAGVGEREVRLRAANGCLSFYDDQDDGWNDYTGRQAAGSDYTPVYLFVLVQKLGAADLADITIKDITMIYS